MYSRCYYKFITIVKSDKKLIKNILNMEKNVVIERNLRNIINEIGSSNEMIIRNLEKDIKIVEVGEEALKTKIRDLVNDKKRLEEEKNFLLNLRDYF